jgi:hypothetical protein
MTAKKEIVSVVVTASLNQEQDFEELRKFREIFHASDVYGGRLLARMLVPKLAKNGFYYLFFGI